MQLLAYKDPSGRIHLFNESQALPPLAPDYEWTTVIQAEPAVIGIAVEDGGDEFAADGGEGFAEELAEDDAPPVVSATAGEHSARKRVTRRPRRRQQSQQPGVIDSLVPMLTPRPGQTPQERAKELVDAMPEDMRGKMKELVQSFQGPPQDLPPFPRG